MLDQLKIIRKEISSNKIEEAISMLEQIIQINPELRDDLILIKANYAQLSKQQTKGIIAVENESIQRNKIISKLLSIANQLENSYLLLNQNVSESPPSNAGEGYRIDQLNMIISSQEKSKSSYKLICWIILVVGVCLVIAFILFLGTLNHQLYLSTATLLFSLLGGVVPYREIIRKTEVIETLLTLKKQLHKLQNQPANEEKRKMIEKIDDLIHKKLEKQLMVS